MKHHRVRVWKDRRPLSQKPWKMQCTCMHISGAEYRSESWPEALGRAFNHWKYWHRAEA